MTDGPAAWGFSGFSGFVRTPRWRATVDVWVDGVLAVAGMERAGVGEQRRIRPWSTQILVPTTTGRVWFKANAPGLAHEPALHAALASMAADRVDAPLGIDAPRGWMLTPDRGSTLADDHTPRLDEWFEIVQEAADLQRRVAPQAGALLATGMPDCSPTTVPERFDRLLDLYSGLDPSHPSHLSSSERGEFETVRGQVVEAAAMLAGCPLPVTLDHGDLHPGNVLLVDGGLRLFDFGDSQWASAPETLGAMWGWIVQRTDYSWQQIFAAYAEVWSDLVTQAEFDALVAAAMVTLPVNRSMTWWEATSGSTQEELGEWGEAPLSQLRHLLSPWP